jgi:hypothetical protein
MKNVLQTAAGVLGAFLLLQGSLQAAPRYGSNNLGGSTYFSWMLMSQPRAQLDVDNSVVSGYACVVKDTLKGMAKTGVVTRYMITGTEKAGDLILKPLNSVTIQPEGKGYKVKDFPPTPETIPNLMEALADDKQGPWYKSDFAPGKTDRACLEGGVAGALKQIEKEHKIKLMK